MAAKGYLVKIYPIEWDACADTDSAQYRAQTPLYSVTGAGGDVRFSASKILGVKSFASDTTAVDAH